MSIGYYLTRHTLLQHLLLLGSTGSGKTSLFLEPMLEQLTYIGGRERDSTIIVIDLKNDLALFNGLRIAAKRAHLPFKFFTTRRKAVSFGMNPFLQSHYRCGMTKNQVAEMLSRSFGLDFGEIYGGSYFRDMAILLLRAIVDIPEINSFYKLAHYASKHPEFFDLPKRVKDDTTHLSATLDSLADIEPLNVTDEWCTQDQLDHSIDFADILETPQVVYFSLPSTLENRVSFTIAKLVTYLLLTAASMRSEKQKNKVFLCIDEFQRIVSPDFSIFVQQARAFEIGCILACQTVSDLETASRAFTDILEENTITKINLTAMGRQAVLRAIERSPRTITTSPDLDGRRSTTVSRPAFLVPSLDQNDVISMSARSTLGTVQVSLPHGLTQCGGHQVPIRASFHISQEEYERRLTTPWPKDGEGTVEVTGDGRPMYRAGKGKAAEKKAASEELAPSTPKASPPKEQLASKPTPTQTPFQALAPKLLEEQLSQKSGHA